jgi:hypothetical protein
VPALTEEQILEAIQKGEIKGVTLDTNVFHRRDYNLQAPILTNLTVFPRHGIPIIFQDTVAAEVKKHLSEQLGSTDATLSKAIKEYTKKWRLDFKNRDEIIRLAASGRSADKEAASQWNNFSSVLKATTVLADGNMRIADLLDAYFSVTPPFENSAEKKEEFPDAIALMSLDGWAQSQAGLVLAVSHDNGWQAYGETSKAIVVVDDIRKAYSAINQSVQYLASKIVDNLTTDKAPKLDRRIIDAIQARLDDVDFEVEAESYLSVDGTPESAWVEKVTYSSDSSAIDYDDDTITVAFLATATIEAHAEFVLSVRDDGEDHPLDTLYEAVKRDIDFEVVITIPRNAGDEPDILAFEVNLSRLSFNFGYLQPFEREGREYLESQAE